MKKTVPCVLICLLTSAVLVACGPSPAERDALATEVAADVFATQTAEAPTSTPAPTGTPVPLATPTALTDTSFPEPIRKQISRELVDTQESGIGDEEAYNKIAQRWFITAGAAKAIEAEGIEKGWLMPAPTATPIPLPPAATPIPPAATPAHVQAQVVWVIDGYTIEVSMGGELYKVRYIGIDTPETKHPEKPVEWMGAEAAAKNEELVGGKIVELEKDMSETDPYGRLLRSVWIGDLMINAELIRLGYANVSTYPPDVRYQDLFLRMQQEAREAGRALWGPMPTPTPPPTPTAVAPTPEPVEATPTPVPPTQPTATQPSPPRTRNVVISYIFYDGVVKRVESDEYAQVTNNGSVHVNLKGWYLNAGDAGQDFWFPDLVIEPGQSCRVYTNKYHAESCGFSFGSGRAIWNNKGDCGYLYDATGTMVSEYCY